MLQRLTPYRPGAPNGATSDSWGSMMEAEYVAVYSS